MYKIKPISQETLQEIFYDEKSPSCLSDRAGRFIGTRTKSGYWTTKIRGTSYRVHRLIYFKHNPTGNQELIIDHIDGNGLNNKIENLRLCTQAINNRNRKLNVTNVLRIKGISVRTIKGIVYVRCRVRVEGKLKEKYFNSAKYDCLATCIDKAKEFRDSFYTSEFTERHKNE